MGWSDDVAADAGWRLVCVDDLVEALAVDPRPVVLDVRELLESERGHLPGAVILPRRRLEQRMARLVRDRRTPLVVVDGGRDVARGRSDPRARLAATRLERLGYRDVAVLDGGVAAWRRAGLPLASGAHVSSEAFGRHLHDREPVRTIDAATLALWQAQGRRVALCDVRSAAEHTAACIPGAVSLPGFEAVPHALDMRAESDAIVLLSGARTRSLLVAHTLVDLGLDDVAVLDGGTLAWALAGHPLEQASRRRRVTPSMASRRFAELGAARLAKVAGVTPMEAPELAALIDAGSANFGAFDLRDRAGAAGGRVPGSVAVSCDRLLVRHGELVAVRDAPLVLIDDDAVRAHLTGLWLHRLGMPHVRTLAGGIGAWVRAGLADGPADEMPLGWREASAATPGLAAEGVPDWLAAHPSARLLHVDTSASYRRGHLPGAAWLPRGWLESRIGAIAPRLDEPLLLTCSDGTQAAFAAATLSERGYGHVAWLRGGTRLWAAQGRTLASTRLPPQDDELSLPAPHDAEGVRDYLGWDKGGGGAVA